MVKVAVAGGGTGGIGLHIVEAIVAAGRHEVVVLSRSTDHPALDKLGVRAIPVSYDDPTTLVKALDGVHTVISTIAGSSEDTMTKPQLALLDAAVKAGVQRFAPSDFAVGVAPDSPVEVYRLKLPVAEAARKSGLEYTIFVNGVFTNYLASGSGTAGVGYMRPMNFMFDIEHCKATLLGDGSAFFVYTRAEDVAKFVAASLDLERWPERLEARGDRMRLNEILRLAEEVRGQKFETTYLSEKQLVEIINSRNEEAAKQPSENAPAVDMEKVFAQWWLEMLGPVNPSGFEGKNLNELFPQVKPVGVAEFLQQSWGKR